MPGILVRASDDYCSGGFSFSGLGGSSGFFSRPGGISGAGVTGISTAGFAGRSGFVGILTSFAFGSCTGRFRVGVACCVFALSGRAARSGGCGRSAVFGAFRVALAVDAFGLVFTGL
jgi:hypothetical protein